MRSCVYMLLKIAERTRLLLHFILFSVAMKLLLHICAVVLALHQVVVDVSAQTCATTAVRPCLDHTANTLNCKYNFTSSTCTTALNVDNCQDRTSLTCGSNGCYYDSSINNCLRSIAQVNSVFTCSYWRTQSDCQAHGCTFDITQATPCRDVTAQGQNFDNRTSNSIISKVEFSNPVVSADLILSVNISVPYIYVTTMRQNPAFPVVQILPALPVSNNGPGALQNATTQESICSSFNRTNYVAPVANGPLAFTDTESVYHTQHPTYVRTHCIAIELTSVFSIVCYLLHF